MSTTFPLLYFPPISFFIDWQNSDKLFIEKYENYQKQTLRNRCCILTANGKKDLSITVSHRSTRKYNEMKISYEENWQKTHWKTLESSYRSSAYFEYYEQDLKPLIFNDTPYLFEYNLEIFKWLLKVLKLNSDFTFTECFIKDLEENNKDLRNNFKATQILPILPEQKYIQVFSDRFEFENNLSIVDFLFNNGPKFKEFYLNNL